MSAIIIGAPEAAGRTRQGTFAPAQPCATRDSAQIKFTEHVGQGVFALSAICAGDGACVRQAARLLEEAKTAQAVEPNDDVAAIQNEIEALAARLALAKGKAERVAK